MNPSCNFVKSWCYFVITIRIYFWDVAAMRCCEFLPHGCLSPPGSSVRPVTMTYDGVLDRKVPRKKNERHLSVYDSLSGGGRGGGVRLWFVCSSPDQDVLYEPWRRPGRPLASQEPTATWKLNYGQSLWSERERRREEEEKKEKCFCVRRRENSKCVFYLFQTIEEKRRAQKTGPD